jgi:PKD repeat protein
LKSNIQKYFSSQASQSLHAVSISYLSHFISILIKKPGMKKIFTLLFAIITVLSATSFAQPGTPCNAAFTFTVNGSNNTVQFAPLNINTSALLQHQWIFGDGTAGSNIASPSHVYTPGTYHVIHVVSYRSPNDSNLVSCADSADALVTITGLPACNIHSYFSFVRDSIQTNKVYFGNLSTGTHPNTVTRWIFGDGTVSYDANPTHIFQISGAYTVCLTVMNDSLCANDTCKIVQVQLPTNTCNLQPYFTSQVDSSNHLLVHFYNQGTPLVSTDSVTWIFGDGSVSHDANPSHTYSQGGTYNVCLVVKRSTLGVVPCVREFCQVIALATPPPACNIHADFSFVRDSIQSNTIHFTSLTTDTVPWNTIRWTFGDGTTSSDINPTHTYATSGAYTVCLSIKRDSTCGDDTCKIVQVQVPVNNCNLQAYFSSLVDSSNNLQIHFFNQTGGFLPGDSLQWSFGDGGISAALNPLHTYNQAGTYNVCLVVKRFTAGTVPCVREYCKTITLQQPNSCNLSANFNWYSDSSNNRKIYFNNLTATQAANSSANWTFGDGTSSSSWSPDHIYAQPGQYAVCLNVSINGTNCFSDTCGVVSIAANPQDSCVIRPGFVNTADSLNRRKIYFTNTTVASSAVANAHWSFGDGTASYDWNAVHVYNAPGLYVVCLTVSTPNNCTNVICDSVLVQGNPVPPVNCDSIQLAYVYRRDAYMSNKLFFFATSNRPVLQQQWKFTRLADNSAVTVNQNDPVHVFGDTGVYQVCLRAGYWGGCVKEYCHTVTINRTNTPSQCILHAFPNPAHSNVSVNVQLNQGGIITASVFNAQSILLRQYTQQGLAGNNLVTLNIQTLAPGFYTVRLLYGGRVCYTRFQKY